jgi:hypothetical protein
MRSTQVTFSLPGDLVERIKSDAKKGGRSFSAQVRYALLVHYGELTIGEMGGLPVSSAPKYPTTTEPAHEEK